MIYILGSACLMLAVCWLRNQMKSWERARRVWWRGSRESPKRRTKISIPWAPDGAKINFLFIMYFPHWSYRMISITPWWRGFLWDSSTAIFAGASNIILKIHCLRLVWHGIVVNINLVFCVQPEHLIFHGLKDVYGPFSQGRPNGGHCEV